MKASSPEPPTPQPAATRSTTTPTKKHDSTATSCSATAISPAHTAAAVESESESIARYRRADQWCRHHIQANSDFLHCNDMFQVTTKKASQDMQFPLLSLQSLFRNRFVQHLKQQQGGGNFNKKTFLYHQRDELLQQYQASAGSGGDNVGMSIVQLARHHKMSPFTMAKFLVEQVAVLPEEGGVEKRKKYLNAALRQPHVYLSSLDAIQEKFRAMEEEWQQQQQQQQRQQQNPSSASNNSSEITTTTTRLATQVAEAVTADPLLGPRSDRMRHFVGIEYEVALEHMLSARNIPYKSESQLREQGRSKTPDVVLKCPIAVQVGESQQQEWRMITWIDSKALYGDVQTHQQSVLPQCQSYIHRFGPGMVLYFFGHAPLSLLADGNGTENDDLVIVGWELPKSFIWPTGQMSDDIDE